MRRAGLAASAIHGHNPGIALLRAILESDPLLKARALRAAGQIGQRDSIHTAEDFLGSEDEAVRFAAAWSVSLRRGTARAIKILKAMSCPASRFSEYAAQVALRRMDVDEPSAWLLQMSKNGSQRLATTEAGALGVPDLIPWLISQIGQPALARAAGEAFTLRNRINAIDTCVLYKQMRSQFPKLAIGHRLDHFG